MEPYNPYAANATPQAAPAPTASGLLPGMLPQLPVVAVLIMVQGGLEILGGFFAIFYALAMPTLMTTMPRQGANPPPVPPQTVLDGMFYAGLIYAVVLFALGAARMVAGVKMLRYRSYIFVIATLLSGLMTLFTCYCFPTALVLAIYGMILLLNPSVRAAFDLAQDGRTPQQVRAMFGMIG